MRGFALVLCGFVWFGCDSRSQPRGAERTAPPVVPAAAPVASSAWPSGRIEPSEIMSSTGFYFSTAPKVSPEAMLAGACRVQAEGLAAPVQLKLARTPLAELALPDDAFLGTFGRGLTPDDRAKLKKSVDPWILLVRAPGTTSLRTTRRTEKLVLCLQGQLGGHIWDEDTREMFTAAEYKKRRLDEDNDADTLDVSAHVVVHTYLDGERSRLVSIGMRKLGLPDLVVNGVAPNFVGPVGTLLNAVAQTLLESPPTVTDGVLQLDLRALKHPRWVERRKAVEASMGNGRAALKVGTGRPQEGDAENRLLELRFDAKDAASATEQQGLMLARFFGKHPDEPIVHSGDDPRMKAAVARARTGLLALRGRFGKGLSATEALAVKAPFASDEGNGTEWMWLRVTRWEGNTLSGTLDNDPAHITGLKVGAPVKTTVDAIGDYVLTDGKNVLEGLEVQKMLESQHGGSK